MLKGPIRHEHRGNISCTLYSQWHIAEENGVQNRLKEVVAVASRWILEVNTNHFVTKPMQQLRSIAVKLPLRIDRNDTLSGKCLKDDAGKYVAACFAAACCADDQRVGIIGVQKVLVAALPAKKNTAGYAFFLAFRFFFRIELAQGTDVSNLTLRCKMRRSVFTVSCRFRNTDLRDDSAASRMVGLTTAEQAEYQKYQRKQNEESEEKPYRRNLDNCIKQSGWPP